MPSETNPTKAFALEYVPTAAFYRSALRAWLWRAYGGFLVGLVLVALAAVVLVRSYPWLSGFFAGILAAVVGNYRVSRRGALQEVEQLQGAAVQLRIDQTGLTFHAPKVTSHLPWSDLSRAERTATAWMLWPRHRSAPVFLPTEALAGDALEFFVAQLREQRIRFAA
jgi:hypothetical protein